MATVTFPVKIGLDLVLLVADKTLIDMSRQRDSTATELTTRTVRVTEIAAAVVEGKLGDVGSFDDTDQTVGDLSALDLGIRIALLRYSQFYTLTMTEAGVAFIGLWKSDLEDIAAQRRQEAMTPIVAKVDNDKLNLRKPHSTWGSTSDPANPPEI